jgi:retinol dehydrogenase 12
MKPIKYLFGSAGPSGFGSKSTAEEVTEACSDLSSITAIITGIDIQRNLYGKTK